MAGAGGRWHGPADTEGLSISAAWQGRSVSQQQGSLLLKVLGPRPLLRKQGRKEFLHQLRGALSSQSSMKGTSRAGESPFRENTKQQLLDVFFDV